MIKRLVSVLGKFILRMLTYGVLGALVLAIGAFVWYVNRQPDLEIWHLAPLESEFRADGGVDTFAGYLEQEERLFAELDGEVYQKVGPGKASGVNRYAKGSLSDPGRWPRNWNRTFQLEQPAPKVGVLLLHGMSDSPYSLRHLGLQLHELGAWVIGLRIPGHGTAPVGLTRVTWRDMAAAVRLAVVHLREQVGDQPLYLVGYSNGGALAVHHALQALEDEAYPRPQGLALISPEIGIAPAAALAKWQARLGRLLGLAKLAWTSVLPEYDPFKYQSFAVNAGEQAYELTGVIQERLQRGSLAEFPPVLVFQSAVDATVSIDATITFLMQNLPRGGHELVIFDCDRTSELQHLLAPGVRPRLQELLAHGKRDFTLSVVQNASAASKEVVVQRIGPGELDATTTPLGLSWPAGVYSLSHVALPFPPDDPLYGLGVAEDSPGVQIGSAALRGERGALLIPASDMLRMHSNPFFPYLERRVTEFFGLAP